MKIESQTAFCCAHVEADDGWCCDVSVSLLRPKDPLQVTPCDRRFASDARRHGRGARTVRITTDESIPLRRKLLDFLIDYQSWVPDMVPPYLARLFDAVGDVHEDIDRESDEADSERRLRIRRRRRKSTTALQDTVHYSRSVSGRLRD